MKTSLDRGLDSLQRLTKAVLHSLKVGDSNILTPSDVLYLTQMFETYLATPAPNMVSIATDYVTIASLMLDPQMATQWIGLTEDGVRRDMFFTIFCTKFQVIFLICCFIS